MLLFYFSGKYTTAIQGKKYNNENLFISFQLSLHVSQENLNSFRRIMATATMQLDIMYFITQKKVYTLHFFYF